MANATLRLLDPSGTRTPTFLSGQIKFQFNPNELTLTKTAEWNKQTTKSSKKAPPPEFIGAQPSTLSVDMFLDSNEVDPTDPLRDINDDIEKLLGCCTPHREALTKNNPSPPFVAFSWGGKLNLIGVVKSVTVNYKLFDRQGTPTRALCKLIIEERAFVSKKQNPTSGALAVHGSHTVLAGDSLASIAYKEYNDPTLWRALAVKNGIDDPMRVAVGTRLLIPPPNEAGALVGTD
jgi:nucleoid-associated protein YgaU